MKRKIILITGTALALAGSFYAGANWEFDRLRYQFEMQCTQSINQAADAACKLCTNED